MMSGQSAKQDRSAAESQGKLAMLSLRPDDMANLAEDWMGQMAANEAFAAIGCEPQVIAAVFGEQYEAGDDMSTTPPVSGRYTQLWMDLVATQSPESLDTYFNFRVENGSSRKPNREKQLAMAEQMTQAGFVQNAWGFYQASGNPTQYNALVRQWAEANEHPDPESLMYPDLRQQMAEVMAEQQGQGQLEPPPGETNGEPAPEPQLA